MKMSKGLGDTKGCPISYLKLREHHASKPCWSPSTAHTTFLSSRLDLAKNLYRRDLFAHYGCVNAIEFSNEGCLLISGGDDRRVLLWNLESCLSGDDQPVAMVEEHGSNIFCLAFDSLNQKIFSAGNDERVIIHDVKTGKTLSVMIHEEAIYGVSVNPFVDSVFASAGEDGQILIFDIRSPPSADPLLLAKSYDAFHAVQFHPMEPMFVVTANSKEGVILWDVRKPRVPFMKYGEKRSSESSMCARFSGNGAQIVALRRRMHPVLFNTQSATPVCEFDADHYYNSCTMKSCCFAGARDQFILSGSDDFNLYMWRIPDTNSGVKFIPEAHLILKGHRSIVNQVRFNRHNFTIASSGVEKIVKLWSPVPVPGSYGTLDSETEEARMTRRVYTHDDYIGLVLDSGQVMVSHDYSHGSTSEDPKMMAFFDSLVQREVEGWTTNTDLSDDESDPPTPQSSDDTSSPAEDTDDDSTWNPSQPQPQPFALPRRRMSSSRNHGDGKLGRRGSGPQSRGSEWILRLIAKKRAQLLAAKKRRMGSSRKTKSKAKQFIRCFTSSKQYLYRPENNQSGTSAAATSRAAPSDLRRRRHTVAPYTVMSLGSYPDGETDGDSDGGSPGGSYSSDNSDDDKAVEESCNVVQSGRRVVDDDRLVEESFNDAQRGLRGVDDVDRLVEESLNDAQRGLRCVDDDDRLVEGSLNVLERGRRVVQDGQGGDGRKISTRGKAWQKVGTGSDPVTGDNSSFSDTDDFDINKGANSKSNSKKSKDSNKKSKDSNKKNSKGSKKFTTGSGSGNSFTSSSVWSVPVPTTSNQYHLPTTSNASGVNHTFNPGNISGLDVPVLGNDFYSSLNQFSNDIPGNADCDGDRINNQRHPGSDSGTSGIMDITVLGDMNSSYPPGTGGQDATGNFGDIMPITGISTDESGSMLFDLNGPDNGLNIPVNGFDLLNRIGELEHGTGAETPSSNCGSTGTANGIITSRSTSNGQASTSNGSFDNASYSPNLTLGIETNHCVTGPEFQGFFNCDPTFRPQSRTPENPGLPGRQGRTLNPYIREEDLTPTPGEVDGGNSPACSGENTSGASLSDASSVGSINTDSGISIGGERANGGSAESVAKPVFKKKKISESRLKNYRYRRNNSEVDE